MKREMRRKDRIAAKKEKIYEQHTRLFFEHVKAGGTLEQIKRFGTKSHLPPKMKHETDIQYAKRVIRQLMGKNAYTTEAAIEHYKMIAQVSGVSTQKAFTLFMSPKAA